MSFARAVWVFALAAFFAVVPLARADEPHAQGKGLAVVAADGATDAAWPLAQAVYANAALRPRLIDDVRARVLAGEPPPDSASAEIKSLAELRAGVKGDDAASRELLAGIAQRLSVQAIVVVFPGEPPTARVYDARARAFDAARYQPDAPQASPPRWDGALASIERPYAPPPAVKVAPAAVAPTPAPLVAKKSESKAFWQSPWFWVAIGAGVLIGGGVLIATNVNTSDTIHLQIRLP